MAREWTTSGGSGTKNRTSFAVGHKNVTTAGTAVQMDAQVIPDGFALVVKAKAANTGNIEVGQSAAVAQGATPFTLAAKEKVKLAVSNANLVYLDATVNGEGVEWIVET